MYRVLGNWFLAIFIELYRVGDNTRTVNMLTSPRISEQLGTRARVKHYNIDLSSWYEFWFALICIDMNIISAPTTTIQQFRDGFNSK